VADDLEDAIRENASGPAEAHGDAGGMKQHPLSHVVEADKHLAGIHLRASSSAAR